MQKPGQTRKRTQAFSAFPEVFTVSLATDSVCFAFFAEGGAVCTFGVFGVFGTIFGEIYHLQVCT
jgi:hypothetical protein